VIVKFTIQIVWKNCKTCQIGQFKRFQLICMLVLTKIGATMSGFLCSTCEIKQFEMLEMKYFTVLLGVYYVWSEEGSFKLCEVHMQSM